MLRSPKEIYLPEWWWSPVPFYRYINHVGVGWGTLVDRHPGMFNLAWAMSGVQMPPQSYLEYAPSVVWVFTESGYIPMAGKTMADWAFYLARPDFAALLKREAAQIKRWKFHDNDMSYDQILRAVSVKAGARGA